MPAGENFHRQIFKNMQEKIKNLIKEALKKLEIEVQDVILEHPADVAMGDYSTNVAMVYAKKVGRNPKELAEKISDELNKNKPQDVEKIQAKNGFINFYLSKEFFVKSIEEILENKNFGKNSVFAGKKIMMEYTDPNPFKPFHIGHLMTNAIGESLSRIMEFSGAKTIRANYQGDIGPHVAKAIYGLLKFGMPGDDKSVPEKASYIGECYAKGSNLYDTDEKAKEEIDELNKKLYDKSDEKINEIYEWGKKITLEAFDEIYKMLGTSFNYYFFESIMAPVGQKLVKEYTGKIFEESEGAIVFHAEKYDPKLHTRVFINSQGLPTYETKELGLTETKFEKENPDLSIVITGKEQLEYMKVVKKAIEQIDYKMSIRMKHITHGLMRLSSGKMSSRKGNVVTGESLIRQSCAEILEKIKDRDISEEEKKEISKDAGVAALKYSILKQNIGDDIVYDSDKSISFEGDSGPYLQYSCARANSVVEKAKTENILMNFENLPEGVSSVERLLYRFPEVVERSAVEFEPHYIANYLIELSRAFNTYYGNTKIIDKEDTTSPYKLALTYAFYSVVKSGLYLLGIKVPEKM